MSFFWQQVCITIPRGTLLTLFSDLIASYTLLLFSLLVIGSADKTVKFWDLETFELIGSGGTEVSYVMSLLAPLMALSRITTF